MDRFCFPTVLKVVSRVKAVIEGMEVHGLAAKLGFGDDPFVETGLVRMYEGCGRILDARRVFDKMAHRDVVTWSVMINGYGVQFGFSCIELLLVFFFFITQVPWGQFMRTLTNPGPNSTVHLWEVQLKNWPQRS